jgi:hypothetical protein
VETIDQIATKANEKMASQKQIYSSALQKFNISKKDNAPKEKQIELFEDFRDKAITFFNCVENCISSTEISGAFKSEHWSKDLTDTAVNVLESIAIFYEKYNREAKELGLNILKPSKNAYSGMQSAVAIYNKDQVKEFEASFTKLGLPIRGFTHPRKMNKHYNTWEKWVMFFTVVVFMFIMLAIGLWNKNYTPEGFWIFRVVLALIGGAFAFIAIPGSLKVEARLGKFAITAVGSIGVTVLIYLLNPPALMKGGSTSTVQPEKPHTEIRMPWNEI